MTTAFHGTSPGGNASGQGGASAAGRAAERRTELASFLRSRRERITPEDVGLPPGHRRRTSGLRREEVAQLAGVGVTWYTWLEQGRPINASSQVLDAIARTLRLDATERVHLFRLADLPGNDVPATCVECPLPGTVQDVLDSFTAVPASVVSERFDILAWNAMYAMLFPRVVNAPADERNTLLAALTGPPCCNAISDPSVMCDIMIGHLRANYGKHVGDPAWTHFIRRLEGASPAFAKVWAGQDVAAPSSYVKGFRHPAVGPVQAISTSFAISAVPGARMVVYTPSDPASRMALERLSSGEFENKHFPCWPVHDPVVHQIPAPAAATTIA
ncbi:MAG TPA: helix-turn-helix transcriptional regulator [Trebonia sp.]|jgi:transcriptional regulator with XRE-family HTH domain|nr:helix-turn-helix transcriptional regulator [Trebonia sp.]